MLKRIGLMLFLFLTLFCSVPASASESAESSLSEYPIYLYDVDGNKMEYNDGKSIFGNNYIRLDPILSKFIDGWMTATTFITIFFIYLLIKDGFSFLSNSSSAVEIEKIAKHLKLAVIYAALICLLPYLFEIGMDSINDFLWNPTQ